MEDVNREEGKVKEYHEIGTHLKGYPEEDVRKAPRLVSSIHLSFWRSGRGN